MRFDGLPSAVMLRMVQQVLARLLLDGHARDHAAVNDDVRLAGRCQAQPQRPRRQPVDVGVGQAVGDLQGCVLGGGIARARLQHVLVVVAEHGGGAPLARPGDHARRVRALRHQIADEHDVVVGRDAGRSTSARSSSRQPWTSPMTSVRGAELERAPIAGRDVRISRP